METYSVKTIAEMLNTNPETVRRWIRSGKLEAIQESRKGGNVISKEMLDAFLEKAPKYAGIASGLLSVTSAIPVVGLGVGMLGAVAASSVMASQSVQQQTKKNEQDKVSEVKNLLLNNIQTLQGNIKKKQDTIKNLEQEIIFEQQQLDAMVRMLESLNPQITADEFMMGEDLNE